MKDKFEWRVSYRRFHWAQPKIRYFQREHAAVAFHNRLYYPSKNMGLGPIADLAIERRWVGEWERERNDIWRQ